MVVGRKDSEEVDTCMSEQEVDVEEGGGTLEEERGRRVGGMKEVGRYNDDNSGIEENDDDHDEDVEKLDVEDVEKLDVEDVEKLDVEDVDDGKDV